MKRVLVTGGAGFLGYHLLDRIMRTTDWHVVVPVSFRHGGYPRRLEVLLADPAVAARVTVVKCDLSAPIDRITRDLFGDVEQIYNLAANSSVFQSIANPEPFIKNNSDLMVNVLEYARTLPNLEVFVHVSTDEVYGSAPMGKWFAEWADPYLPSNPYAASKVAAEAYAIAYWRSYGLPIILTNAMNLTGRMQDTEKFIPNVIAKVARGETVTIHTNPDGSQGSRMYVPAQNHAAALLFVEKYARVFPDGLRYSPDVRYPHRFHVAGIELTNLELAEKIAGLMYAELKYELVDAHSERPGHDTRYALDDSKLHAARFKPVVTLEECLADTIDYALANPEWLTVEMPREQTVLRTWASEDPIAVLEHDC